MKICSHLLFMITLCSTLTGCIGAQIVTGKTYNTTKTTDFTYKDKTSYKAIRGNPHKIDTLNGNETWTFYEQKKKWCGLYLHVIITIPLALPVCEISDTIIWDSSGIAIQEIQKETETHGGYCAPLAPALGRLIGHHSDVDVCE